MNVKANMPTGHNGLCIATDAKFYGTIEMVSSTRAVIALTDSRGETVCASRIDGPGLYERGFALLSISAAAKGGSLERYSREVAS